jgi:hypothetical protein
MRRILCTVILVCAAVALSAGQEVEKKSAPGAKPPATADVQQILRDRLREYNEALTKRDLAALDKIWAEGYTFTLSSLISTNSMVGCWL